MTTPDFVLSLRKKIGTDPLWLSAVTAVVVRPTSSGEELLLVKRSDTGAWTPVTGIIDPAEHPAAAAVREVLEEADVHVSPEKLLGVSVSRPIVYPNGDRSQYLEIAFRMRYQSGEPFPADGENTEARWYRADDLPEMPEDMAEHVRLALDNAPEARFEF